MATRHRGDARPYREDWLGRAADGASADELEDWGEIEGDRLVPSAGLEDHVEAVRAQLAPIASRAALLDSFRRESLSLLAPAGGAASPEVAALEIAYALRWRELEERGDGELVS